ncbi:MAG: hypothetical protein AW10_03953 [Candidatus Accumulibacter appositus]|uniref:Secreted protein n=1 Tax=Candidatus Accumulibacter appositus TaxID=1454003 RepID=A0A011PJF2_9PROT|nr:MAG: hypothetical protein AW10_03953 [Candidatus Accumulibacter appositus]
MVMAPQFMLALLAVAASAGQAMTPRTAPTMHSATVAPVVVWDCFRYVLRIGLVSSGPYDSMF